MAESVELINPEGPPGGGSSQWKDSETSSEKPEGVPDKFWDTEKGEVDSASLLASYVALEQKLGSSTPVGETSADASSPTPDSTPSSPDSMQDQDKFNIGRYEDEYRANENQLKEESYTELHTKFGIDKGEVDKYIQYRQAEADSFAEEIFTMAGGEDSYRTLLGWAGNNLPAQDVARLNTILETSNQDQVRVEVLKLSNAYRDAVGAEPQSLVGGTTSTNRSGLKAFASIQEAVEARKDKRFSLDPAYRQEWEQRVGRSAFVGHTT